MTKAEAETLLAMHEQANADENDAAAFVLGTNGNAPHHRPVRHILRLWSDAKRCRLAGLIVSASNFENCAEMAVKRYGYVW